MSKLDYTIDDEIVCIYDSDRDDIQEGKIYIAKALLPCNCKCDTYMVDIGIRSSGDINSNGVICEGCNVEYIDDGIEWLGTKRFKKLDTLVNINELLEVLEQPIFQ